MRYLSWNVAPVLAKLKLSNCCCTEQERQKQVSQSPRRSRMRVSPSPPCAQCRRCVVPYRRPPFCVVRVSSHRQDGAAGQSGQEQSGAKHRAATHTATTAQRGAPVAEPQWSDTAAAQEAAGRRGTATTAHSVHAKQRRGERTHHTTGKRKKWAVGKFMVSSEARNSHI